MENYLQTNRSLSTPITEPNAIQGRKEVLKNFICKYVYIGGFNEMVYICSYDFRLTR